MSNGRRSAAAQPRVIIVGSGAGGAPLALRLAEAGCEVVVLEKGPWITRDQYPRAAEANHRFFIPPGEPHTVVTRKTKQGIPTDLGWIAACVGGGTVHMGAYLYRFRPIDFRMASTFGTYEELADWPFEYDDLEPYYGVAESLVGVAGGQPDDAWQAPRTTPLPMPPLDAHPIAARLEHAARARGLRPFTTPRAVNQRPYDERPTCAYCELCAGYGCPVGARGSAQEAILPRAIATGRCTVMANQMVREITVSRQGHATGCRVLDAQGRERHEPADLVCVSASAIESARLLLLSTSNRFPEGIGNDHGRVGRHLQFHAVTMAQGLVAPERLSQRERGSTNPFLGRSIADYYTLPDGVSDIAKGGLLRFSLPPSDATSRANGQRMVGFEVFHDFIPNQHTRVTLDPDVRDRWGLPVARIHLDIPSHHRQAGQWLLARGTELLEDLGVETWQVTDLGGTSSYLVHGTCRAGVDPTTSVLDPHCRVHDVPNLYVVDGSFMPTSGGASPTLTIIANSLRVADQIIARGNHGAFASLTLDE